MKKIFLYMSAAALAMTMAACGSGSDDDDDDDDGLNPKKLAKENVEKYCECMKINKSEGWSEDFDRCLKEYEELDRDIKDKIEEMYENDPEGRKKFEEEYERALRKEMEKMEDELESYERKSRSYDGYNYYDDDVKVEEVTAEPSYEEIPATDYYDYDYMDERAIDEAKKAINEAIKEIDFDL